MDLGLTGKAALVTGGSKGLGKAIAKGLIAEGAKVALLARNPESLAIAAAELGDGVVTVSADTTDDAAVRAAVDEAAAKLGGLEIVVNSAAAPAAAVGRPSSVGIEGFDEAEFLQHLQTKSLGYLRVARAATPHLKANGGGRIVNIAGMNARVTGSFTHTTRNLAVVALTKTLADELGHDNIAVTCVHPGMTRTDSREFDEKLTKAAESNALGRVIDSSEIADLVTFLASPRATLVNGAIIEADGSRPGILWP